MTRQYTGRNNITISTMDGGSVPIVSQTEIEPMKTALSCHAAHHDDGAHRAAARTEAAGAGRLVLARLHREPLILRAVTRRCGRHRQAEQWLMPVRMDCERKQLLSAQRPAQLRSAMSNNEPPSPGEEPTKAGERTILQNRTLQLIALLFILPLFTFSVLALAQAGSGSSCHWKFPKWFGCMAAHESLAGGPDRSGCGSARCLDRMDSSAAAD